MRVKGRGKPTRIYTAAEALGLDGARYDAVNAKHMRRCSTTYRGRDWDGAEAAIVECEKFGDRRAFGASMTSIAPASRNGGCHRRRPIGTGRSPLLQSSRLCLVAARCDRCHTVRRAPSGMVQEGKLMGGSKA